jgi:hypothetical protein
VSVLVDAGRKKCEPVETRKTAARPWEIDDELRTADLLDFSRAAVDSSRIRAMKGGSATGPSPVDRGKAGSQHHLIVKAHGIPLAAITTGGNRNDVTRLIPLIQAVPADPRPAVAPPLASVRRLRL